MTKPIYEIRDYTIESEWFGAYKEWAKDIAAPWLKENLEVIDFWMDEGEPPEVSGSNPIVSPNGQPNVTWIIKWDSRETRDCLLYTSPSPRDRLLSRMPSSA